MGHGGRYFRVGQEVGTYRRCGGVDTRKRLGPSPSVMASSSGLRSSRAAYLPADNLKLHHYASGTNLPGPGDGETDSDSASKGSG